MDSCGGIQAGRLASSTRNECQSCVNAHVDIVDIEDIVDDPLRHIADPGPSGPRAARRRMHEGRPGRSNQLPDDLMAEIHAEFTDPELIELTFLIGYINLLNLFNNSLGVRYHGDYRALLDG